MFYNLLQETRDINAKLLEAGYLSKDDYLSFEEYADLRRDLFTINLN